MATIFSKIIKGEIPCYKIAENDKFFAFLDINPLAKGHTLVVPKQEIDYIFDIDDDLIKEYMVFAKRVARAIKKAIPCHIHLVPIESIYDMDFKRNKLQLTKTEFEDIASRISGAFE